MRTLTGRMALGALLGLHGLAAHAATKPAVPDSWLSLHGMPIEELRNAGAALALPRHRLMLAVHEVPYDLDRATTELARALATAEAGGDVDRLGKVLHCAIEALQNAASSAAECNEMEPTIQAIEEPLPRALAHRYYGIWLATYGEYARAMRANRSAERLALTIGDPLLAAISQNNQGVDYLIRGLPAQALKKLQAALEHLRRSDMPNQEPFILNLTGNIASAHLELGETRSANEMLRTLMASDDYDPANPNNLITEVHVARATRRSGDPQGAYDRLNEVIGAVGARSNSGVHAFALSVLGDLEIALGNPKQGIATLRRAKYYSARSGDPLRVNKTDVRFASALVGLGRYAEAEAIVEASIASLSEREPSMILAEALYLRGEVADALGQRSAAREAKRQSQNMRTQILGAEHDLELAMLAKSLELATKANELASAQHDAKVSEASAQRNIRLRNQILLIALLVTLIAYLGLSRRYERKAAKTIQDANAELEAKVCQRTAALEQEMAQRLEAESGRRELEQSLAESEKLQALGQLTSGVAHDFNNLMTVVTLAAGLLKNTEHRSTSESDQNLDNILAAAESASDITASLLAYARKQPLTPEPTDLHSFLEDCQPLFESTLGEGVRLITQIEPCTILVDRSKLTTAIINLLLNAKEAMQGRGIARLQVNELLKVNEQGETQQWASIVVSDQGRGMAPAQLRRATEPFYTTKAVGQGTGLGLSMVDGFAKQSGGFLEIDSAPWEGSAVTLNIPLATTSAVPAAEAGPVSTAVDDLGVALIVDDQEALRNVLGRLLEQMGLETLRASSGAEALDLLQQTPRPKLLITDLMMPGAMNGQQLATQVRARYPEVAVLIMSGYTDTVELDVEFLHKPFSLNELRQAISRCVANQNAA